MKLAGEEISLGGGLVSKNPSVLHHYEGLKLCPRVESYGHLCFSRKLSISLKLLCQYSELY